MLLHGADDDSSAWTREVSIAERCADLDALVLLPDGGRVGLYTDWERPDASGVAPRWEGFHLDELPALLEASYRASTTRVVAGVSMGGYGAIAYAARRPGMFAAAAFGDGFCDFEDLFRRFYRARSGDHRQLVAADRRISDFDHRFFRPQIPGN